MDAGTIRQLVAVSDIHSGSTVSILPPNFVNYEGRVVGRTPLMEWFWEAWEKNAAWVLQKVGDDPAALVINGDLIEGDHHGTKQIWSKDIADHSKAALETLEAFCGCFTKKFMVLGTECHVGMHERSLAADLGCEINPEHKQRYWDRLSLEIAEVPISVRHHFPATSRVHLEASQHSIQLGNARLEALRAGRTPPRIILGAHRHRPGHWSDGEAMSVVTGAWQGITRHGFKVVPDAVPCPRIYHLDWRNKKDGELPDLSWLRLEAPAEKTVVL